MEYSILLSNNSLLIVRFCHCAGDLAGYGSWVWASYSVYRLNGRRKSYRIRENILYIYYLVNEKKITPFAAFCHWRPVTRARWQPIPSLFWVKWKIFNVKHWWPTLLSSRELCLYCGNGVGTVNLHYFLSYRHFNMCLRYHNNYLF